MVLSAETNVTYIRVHSSTVTTLAVCEMYINMYNTLILPTRKMEEDYTIGNADM